MVYLPSGFFEAWGTKAKKPQLSRTILFFWPCRKANQPVFSWTMVVFWLWYPRPPENNLANKPLRDPSEMAGAPVGIQEHTSSKQDESVWPLPDLTQCSQELGTFYSASKPIPSQNDGKCPYHNSRTHLFKARRVRLTSTRSNTKFARTGDFLLSFKTYTQSKR